MLTELLEAVRLWFKICTETSFVFILCCFTARLKMILEAQKPPTYIGKCCLLCQSHGNNQTQMWCPVVVGFWWRGETLKFHVDGVKDSITWLVCFIGSLWEWATEEYEDIQKCFKGVEKVGHVPNFLWSNLVVKNVAELSESVKGAKTGSTGCIHIYSISIQSLSLPAFPILGHWCPSPVTQDMGTSD